MPIDELVYEQAPVMTDRHIRALESIAENWCVEMEWCLKGEFDLALIGEVVLHLKHLVRSSAVTMAPAEEGTRMIRITRTVRAEPLIVVPERAGYLDDWRVVWRPPTLEEIYDDCDQ